MADRVMPWNRERKGSFFRKQDEIGSDRRVPPSLYSLAWQGRLLNPFRRGVSVDITNTSASPEDTK
jgi:hypothetical protein